MSCIKDTDERAGYKGQNTVVSLLGCKPVPVDSSLRSPVRDRHPSILPAFVSTLLIHDIVHVIYKHGVVLLKYYGRIKQ